MDVTAELIGILTVGVAIAALILTSTGRLRSELGARIGALEVRFGALEQCMARLEGLLEGAGLYRPAAVAEQRPATGAAQPAASD